MEERPDIELTWHDHNGSRIEGFSRKKALRAAQTALTPSVEGWCIIAGIQPYGLEKTPEAIAKVLEAAETVTLYYGNAEQYRRDGHFSCTIVPRSAQASAAYRKIYGDADSGTAYH